MHVVGQILTISAIVPLAGAATANRSTSLAHATVWAIMAWAGWVLAFAAALPATGYLALVLTSCAGVAVLGARKPGVTAWNFVVAGLLIVLLLPIEQSAAVGTDLHPGTIHNVFLASLLAVTVICYLPTRLVIGAAVFGIGCGCVMRNVIAGEGIADATSVGIGSAPWLAWGGFLIRGPRSSADRTWLAFRDRFGLIWALRLREQFARAAENVGLASRIRWNGVRPPDPSAADILAALTKRFLEAPPTV
jgi:hypothetical protein